MLAHTYLPNSIIGVRVNGERASEGRLNALVAAEYGVPVVLVTGDDRTCADAAGYAPAARAVAVKECVSRYSAVCRTPSVTAAAIRSAAAGVGKLAGRRAPVRAATYHVEVDVDAAQLAQAAAIVPTVEQAGERTVAYEQPTAYEMIRCFKAVATLISAAIENSMAEPGWSASQHERRIPHEQGPRSRRAGGCGRPVPATPVTDHGPGSAPAACLAPPARLARG